MIPYGHQTIAKDDIQAVVKVLKSDYLTQGPKIIEFEKALAKYTGASYAVVFNSGTAALHAAYFACGLKSNDEFITTPITFAATANAGLYLGAKPIFADIENNTGNIDISQITSKITKKVRLIVPVHYGGFTADLERINKLAKKNNLYVIEDACHALGAKYLDESIGNCKFSDMAVFSFHPVKHITTGEGGAVTTNNKEFYKRMLMFRTHGITGNKEILKNRREGKWFYEMQYLGFNYRMSDIQAALGISQLQKINQFIKKRRRIASVYDKFFKDNPYFDIISAVEKNIAAHHLYPILLRNKSKNNKKKIFDQLRKKGVGVQVHYIPVYLHPYYQNLGYHQGLCPVAEKFYKREISIPIYPAMNNNNITYVIKTIFDVLKSNE